MNPGTVTRSFVVVALMLELGVATAYAQRPAGHVKMTFSGTNVATTINLQANTVTDEMLAAGKGTFGRFTFRELHADGTAPQPPAGCTGPSFGVLKGAGVFRFQDGSLLIVTLKDGTGCINLVERFSALVVNYEINGGTGRFANASGELTMTATQTPVLRNAANAPALLPIVGQFEGTIFRAEQEHDDR
jgi:hypothetical protein